MKKFYPDFPLEILIISFRFPLEIWIIPFRFPSQNFRFSLKIWIISLRMLNSSTLALLLIRVETLTWLKTFPSMHRGKWRGKYTLGNSEMKRKKNKRNYAKRKYFIAAALPNKWLVIQWPSIWDGYCSPSITVLPPPSLLLHYITITFHYITITLHYITLHYITITLHYYYSKCNRF